MRLEHLLLASQTPRDGPLQQLDPRLTLATALSFIILVVATPVGWWRILGAEILALSFVVGLSGVPPRALLFRWFGFLLLVGFLAAMVAPSHPQRAQFGVVPVFVTILAKNSVAFLATLVLTSVTPFPTLLMASRRLGMPVVLVATLQVMYRYLHVLADELERMVQARRSRSFRRSGRLDWGILTSMIGVLFVRAFERGERVHAAMLARGWDGTIRTLDPSDPVAPLRNHHRP